MEKTGKWVSLFVNGHWTPWLRAGSVNGVEEAGRHWIVLSDEQDRPIERFAAEYVLRISEDYGAEAPKPIGNDRRAAALRP